MKKWMAFLIVGFMLFPLSALRADVTAEGQGQGKATVQETQRTQGLHADGTAGATVTKSSNEIRITGISSAVAVVDTKKVTGDASGTLVIRWGRGGSSHDERERNDDRSGISNPGHEESRSIFRQARVPMTPPGAPELPANFMFGAGFFIFGFGLLLTRKLW